MEQRSHVGCISSLCSVEKLKLGQHIPISDTCLVTKFVKNKMVLWATFKDYNDGQGFRCISASRNHKDENDIAAAHLLKHSNPRGLKPGPACDDCWLYGRYKYIGFCHAKLSIKCPGAIVLSLVPPKRSFNDSRENWFPIRVPRKKVKSLNWDELVKTFVRRGAANFAWIGVDNVGVHGRDLCLSKGAAREIKVFRTLYPFFELLHDSWRGDTSCSSRKLCCLLAKKRFDKPQLQQLPYITPLACCTPTLLQHLDRGVCKQFSRVLSSKILCQNTVRDRLPSYRIRLPKENEKHIRVQIVRHHRLSWIADAENSRQIPVVDFVDQLEISCKRNGKIASARGRILKVSALDIPYLRIPVGNSGETLERLAEREQRFVLTQLKQ